jgi:hypothetical protein
MTLTLQFVIFLLTLAFGAGGAWVTLHQSQRHVNGLGSKFNRLRDEIQDRDRRHELAILLIAKDEPQKTELLNILLPGGPGAPGGRGGSA